MGILNFFKKNKDEYYLENVRELNKKNSRTFLIPTQDEIDKIDIGDTVKLIFVMIEPQKNGCRAERMWVKIIENNGTYFTGKLDNEPYYLKTINSGDIINFKPENIAAIYGGQSPFDEDLFAIITKRALDKRQINYVVKSNEIDDIKDSGWQLFYGNEDEAYTDDPSNASVVLLKQVLEFEPLLEDVFGGIGKSYEYSKNDNRFLELNE